MAKGRKAKIKEPEMGKEKVINKVTGVPVVSTVVETPKEEPKAQPEIRTAVIQPSGEMVRIRVVKSLMRRYRIPDCIGDVVTYPKALVQKAIENGEAEIVK